MKNINQGFVRVLIIAGLVTGSGCIKEYDMTKLSEEMHFTPAMGISGIKGSITLRDALKANDTIVYDKDNFLKLVFKKDSVIELKVADLYNINNMVTFSQTYTVGVISLNPFSGAISYTLNEISQRFLPAARAQFVALSDGLPHPFPAFGQVNLPEKTYPLLSGFESAVFKSGYLDITVRNNLAAPLSGITLNLYNSSGHTAIVTGILVPVVQPGQTQIVSVDLTDKTMSNSVIAAVTLAGSTGNLTPVIINLNSNIQITVTGRDMKIKSGRVVITQQPITSLDNKDTIAFDAGPGVELEKVVINSGAMTYQLRSSASLSASLTIGMPTAIRNGTAVTENLTVGRGALVSGSIPFSNTSVDLGTITTNPFNSLPVTYSIQVSSNNTMVTFNSTDNVKLDLKLTNPVIDYAKGYFGQETELIEPESIDLGIEEILSNLTGDFYLSNPSITLKYSNSFAIPVYVNVTATGNRGSKTVNLGYPAFNIVTPAYPASRDVSRTLIIDKTNSSLPSLISLPPEKIVFSGSAKMNPSGNNGLRNNYIFGSSRILGSVEVEVPMEFRMNNLQFSDTMDNFLKSDGNDSQFVPENFGFLKLNITAKNGFPLGASMRIILYDEISGNNLSSLDVKDFFGPAPVDIYGRVPVGVTTETTSKIEFSKEFFNTVNKAGKMIFQITLNTTGSGAKDIKIYSDYKLDFSASLIARPDIKLK